MSRRFGAWWIAGVTLPLVLAGLILMHTVDISAADVPVGHEHSSAGDAVAPVEIHGDHQHGCDDCHLGLHITAACVAVLGSIAVWRVANRVIDRKMRVDVGASTTSGRPRPPSLRLRALPARVEFGVMLC